MKTFTDAEVRARHAARVLEVSAGVVAAVHDEGAAEILTSIRRALAVPAPDDVDPVAALVTVLAAAIDPSRTLHDLVGWTKPLRTVPNTPVTADSSLACDVHLLMSGRPVAEQVSTSARREAVVLMSAMNLTANEIGDRIGMSGRAVTRVRTSTPHDRVKEAS